MERLFWRPLFQTGWRWGGPGRAPHLQNHVPFLDVAVSGRQALGGDVLDKNVAGQAQAIFCLWSEGQKQRAR